MKKHYLLKNKSFKFFIICLLIGFLLSIIYYFSLKANELKTILDSINNSNPFFYIINNSIEHIKILSLVVLLSYIYIGFPLFIGLIISEGFKIFIKFIFMYKLYKFKGTMYIILYTLLHDLIYLIILYFILKRLFILFKYLYKYKIKNEVLNYNQIYNNLIRLIFFIIINFIYDYFLYLYGTNILKIFRHICKI